MEGPAAHGRARSALEGREAARLEAGEAPEAADEAPDRVTRSRSLRCLTHSVGSNLTGWKGTGACTQSRGGRGEAVEEAPDLVTCLCPLRCLTLLLGLKLCGEGQGPGIVRS